MNEDRRQSKIGKGYPQDISAHSLSKRKENVKYTELHNTILRYASEEPKIKAYPTVVTSSDLEVVVVEALWKERAIILGEDTTVPNKARIYDMVVPDQIILISPPSGTGGEDAMRIGEAYLLDVYGISTQLEPLQFSEELMKEMFNSRDVIPVGIKTKTGTIRTRMNSAKDLTLEKRYTELKEEIDTDKWEGIFIKANKKGLSPILKVFRDHISSNADYTNPENWEALEGLLLKLVGRAKEDIDIKRQPTLEEWF